jgi:asparagine synthase (glutamine-hydrolysing)
MNRLPIDRQFKRMARHAYEKDYGAQSFGYRYIMRVSMYDPKGLVRLYSGAGEAKRKLADTYGYMHDFIQECASQDPLDRVDYATVRAYLAEDILVKVDRMSMAVSLEARCPFLDHEFAGLVGRIPSRLKMNGRETKYILKKMVTKKGLVPPEIANRKKQGFGAPIQSWMRKEWREVVPHVLDPIVTKGYTGIFDREEVRSLIQEPYVNSSKLFALITFVLWYRMYIEEARVDGPSDGIGVLA